MSESRAWTRTRFLLALLLAVLVAQAVPAPAAAARRDKGSAASAWRAPSARPAEQGGDPNPDGPSSFAALPPAPLAFPFSAYTEADAPRIPPRRPAAPVAARQPLPRAPPLG